MQLAKKKRVCDPCEELKLKRKKRKLQSADCCIDDSAEDFILDRLCNRYPPLQIEEEIKLFRRVKEKNSKKARQKLILHNLPYAVKLAKLYRSGGLDLADLIQESVFGINHGIDKFDPSLGYKFSTYLTWWIKDALRKAIKTKALLIRLPARVYDICAKAKGEWSRIKKEEKRQATSAELAVILQARGEKVTAQEIERFKDHIQLPLSLDRQTNATGDGDQDGTCVGCRTHNDTVPDSSIVENGDGYIRVPKDGFDSKVMFEIDKAYVRDCVNSLPPLLAKVITRKFGLGIGVERTRVQIAMELDITEDGVEELEEEAIMRLRQIVDPELVSHDDSA